MRHWTVFHMFLVRLAIGFWLHFRIQIGVKRENGLWETRSHCSVLLVKDRLGANGKDSQRKQSPSVNPFRFLRFNRNPRVVHPGLQKYFKEEGLFFEAMANANIPGWSAGLDETMGKG